MLWTFFFNIFSLIVGIIYAIAFKKKWRVHGIVLAFAAALGTFIIQIYGSKAELYPLFFMLAISWGIMGADIFGMAIYSIIKRKRKKKGREIIPLFLNLTPKKKTVGLIAILIIPVVLWGSVSVDFNVMFDNKPQMLWVHGPSTIDEGESFDLIVEAWDQYERLSTQYQGTVQFSLESYNLTIFNEINSEYEILPLAYTFSGQNFPSDMAYSIQNGKDNGLHTFEMQITLPGIHYVKVYDSVTDNIYYSNPIIVQNSSNDIHWGDFHSHSLLSDGSGTPKQNFHYARHVAGLEFHALTEHGEIIDLGANWLDIYKRDTDLYYEPGKFVTFYGMEYTNHGSGHYTCIFDGDSLPEEPLLSFREPSISNPYDLWDVLDNFTDSTGSRALALPHHTLKVRYMQDWSYLNPKYVKIAEVTSVHGDCLFEYHNPLNYRGATVPPSNPTNGSSIVNALKMGHRISLYGSSDGHDGHPGHTLAHTKAYVGHQRPYTYWWTRFDKPYPGGLTAVYSPDLTREQIFSNLQNRMVYANSDFGRPILNFTINGVGVGHNSTIFVENSTSNREIRIFLAQDGSPAANINQPATVGENWHPNWEVEIEIIKNGDILTSIPINKPVVDITYNDNATITGVEYGAQSCVNINGTYYLNQYSDNPISNPEELTTNGVDFYLIRIVGDNGRHSYIGPIWVEVE